MDGERGISRITERRQAAGTTGHKTRRCRNGVLIRVMNLRSQPKLKLPNRIGVSPTRYKSVSPVGDAAAQPAIAQLRAPWNGGRLGVSAPLIESAYSPLPY